MRQRRPASSVIIVGVYHPPQSRVQWFDTFNDLTHELLNRNKLVIMGDTNLDILRPMAQPGKALLNLLALAGTRPTFTLPTRITHTTATWIDIIAVNEDIEVNIVVTADSDYYPVTTVITFSHPHKLKPIVKRYFNKVNFEELYDMVQQTDISAYEHNSPELLIQEWQKAFTDILDTVAPVRTFPMRHHRSPYLNGEIRQLIRHRDFLEKQFKKNPGSSTLKQDLKLAQRRKVGSIERQRNRQLWL